MQKYNLSKKTFFLAKYYFLCLNMDYTHFNFLKVYNSPVAQNFKFLSFSTWKFQILSKKEYLFTYFEVGNIFFI